MYKDLSLKEKSELFKLMVSNGITDINEIEKIYNRYEDGGSKISVNNLPESEQYAVTTPDGQRKTFNNKEEVQQYITTNTPKGYSLYDTTNYGSNIDKGQTAILDRNTEREIEKATEEEIRTNARKANIESNKEYAMEALNAIPIIGDGMDIYSIVKDTYNKNYGNAALTAGMMLVPFDKLLKPVGKGIKKLYNKARKKSNAELTDNFDIEKLLSNLKPLEQTFLIPKEKIYIPDQLSLEESRKINDFWNNIFLNKYDTNRLKIHDRFKRESLPGEFISIKSTDDMALEGAAGHSNGKNAYIYSDINRLDKGETVIHEGTHNFRDTPQTLEESLADYKLDPNERQYVAPSKYTTKEIAALEDAYTFTEDYNYNDLDKSYRGRLAEKGATNTELQYSLYKRYNIKNIPELYKIIDNLTDDDLLYELQQTNSYGRNFVKQLRTLPKKEQNVKIANIRNALKYVPATIGVGAGLSLINNNEDNQYKYGGAINKFDGTSTKTQQMQTMEKPAFFEGDTWKPQYWFSPEYENTTLKEAITQAYEDGNYGKDIIWNGRAYKAILNEEDSKEYRKKKGITLGEPIVNTANIQTNEKQPREYVSNSYIPVTNGNKTYYWDSYSGKFFEDDKGKTPTSKDYNTLLKDYYNQNISPALKENRYEDLIKLYVQQFRNLQARRRVSAREQDIPNDYGKRTIPITTGRSGSSRLPYPTDLIDSLSNHLQEGQSIYQALALPYKETEFGNRINFESDVMGNRGHVLATLNDERYELPDQTFYSGLSYPLRAYFRNNKVDGKVDGMTQENFVKHYLASSENDLLDLKNLFNNKDLLKYVGETLKKDLTKSRFVSFMNTNTEDNPNIYEHALSLLASGKYNPGEPGYNKGINKIAKQLENDPELNSYIDKHKIKKVGEKKK